MLQTASSGVSKDTNEGRPLAPANVFGKTSSDVFTKYLGILQEQKHSFATTLKKNIVDGFRYNYAIELKEQRL